jgi:thiamine-phosphate pyrophosphorylase
VEFEKELIFYRKSMKEPSERLRNRRLYGILDLGYVEREALESTAEELLEGGIDILQLRAKDLVPEQISGLAGRVRPLARDAGVPLIINDHPGVCREVAAEGVHVGQDDTAVNLARAQAMAPHGKGVIVGKSTHGLEQALAAASEGADYIGFGPLFSTPTKPGRSAIGLDEVREVHERVSIPIFCIGGVKLGNLEQIVAAGARRVVIVSGILLAEDRARYIREAKQMLDG